MTSILTNTAAMSALSTLRSISGQMDETQARVSSGLRVGGAADNAAYWSIATTMRSDNMALSSVQDALGLGAAKVDTAYAGMNSAIEVVKEIKAKLVAATESGVDKAKIQEEITQLQDQLTSIAESASFSGQNWLQADLDVAGNKVTQSVIGSFVRSGGTVSVKTVNYDLTSSTVLFDTGDATGYKSQGILNQNATSGTAAPTLTSVQVVKEVVSTKTADDLMAEVTANITAGGSGSAQYVAAWTPGDGQSVESFVDAEGERYIRYYDAGKIKTDDNGKELWVRIKTLDPANNVDAAEIAKATLSKETGYAVGTATTDLKYYYALDKVTQTKEVAGLTKASLDSIDGATITGRVANIPEFNGNPAETYVQLQENKDVWVKVEPGSLTDEKVGININGANYDIVEDNKKLPAALQGADLGFSVSKFDLADLGEIAERLGRTEAGALDFMIQHVDDALGKMTSAAANLGSISMRIDLQSDFVSKLSESIDAGVGRLVDADLNEESTRLKALQTQQQLAIQSLSIANNASQNVLSLFR